MRASTVGVGIVTGLLLLPGTVAAHPAAGAEAGVPRVMQFNGRFRPANGQPPAAVEIVTFAIYADETGGTALWLETQNVTIASGGDYTVTLGSTTPEGLPLHVFTSGQAHWLAVHVDRPGESEQTRIRIISVPYALRAADADTLGGRPASAYQLAGSSGAASTLPGEKRTGTPDTNPVTTSSATTNWIPVAADNSGSLGNSSMFQNGGFIGLGTTSPFDAFHVTFNDPNGAMTGYAVQNKSNSATAYSGMLFYDQNGVTAQFQGFNNSTHEYRINNVAAGGSINFMLGSASKFLVASSGNVGIGAATPGSKLDVAGDINLSGGLRIAGSTILQVPVAANNIGLGFNAVNASVTGVRNLGVGVSALRSVTSGESNTALGFEALKSTDNGFQNVAVGAQTMFQNTSGAFNVALGYSAVANNISGNANVGIGFSTMSTLTAGDSNTAVGFGTLTAVGTGQVNLALGAGAGAHLVGANSNNVDVANTGVAGDNGAVRIGTAGTQSSFFAAGIRGVTTGAADAVSVVIDSNGQLGTINSSRRYKEDIQDMGDASAGLMQLRPVTYRYRQAYADGTKPIDYGLIAEEVERVYQDLVAHLANGEVETVQYQKINAMLLNEVQKQHRTLEEQHTEIELLKARLALLEAQRR